MTGFVTIVAVNLCFGYLLWRLIVNSLVETASGLISTDGEESPQPNDANTSSDPSQLIAESANAPRRSIWLPPRLSCRATLGRQATRYRQPVRPS